MNKEQFDAGYQFYVRQPAVPAPHPIAPSFMSGWYAAQADNGDIPSENGSYRTEPETLTTPIEDAP